MTTVIDLQLVFKKVIGLWSFVLGSLHFGSLLSWCQVTSEEKATCFALKFLTAKEKAVNRDLHTFIQKFAVLSSPVELQFLFFLRLFQNVDSSNSRCIWLSCLSSDYITWKDLFIQSAFKVVSDGSSHKRSKKFVKFFSR